MTEKAKTITFLLVLFCSCWLALWLVRDINPPVKESLTTELPSQTEIQQELISRGFLDASDPNATDGKIGGVCREAWDLAICEQYAEKHFEEKK